MESLSDSSISNIIEFLQPSSLKIIPQINKHINWITSDENKPMWSRITSMYKSTGVVKSGMKSEALTSLTIKAAWNNYTCVICSESTGTYYDMYCLPMCTSCQDKPEYSTSGFKKTCKEYFIDCNSENLKNIPKYKVGEYYKVIKTHVKRAAIELYGDECLENMIVNRENKIRKLRENKIKSRESRLEKISNIYSNDVKNCKQIDPTLKNINILIKYAYNRGIYHKIYGDNDKLIINSNFGVNESVSRFKILARMITFMQKNNIMSLDCRIIGIYEDLVLPELIFTQHLLGNIYYPDYISEIIINTMEYLQKIYNYEFFRHNRCTTKELRYIIANNCCVEDDIDFDYETFEKYITESIGNPVELARNRRKIIHLNKFGYSTLINEYNNYGIDLEEAERMAKTRSYHLSRGYPIMKYVAKIDLDGLPQLV